MNEEHSMNDFRLYAHGNYLSHVGVGHEKGGNSGRYPWGSGERPMQELEGTSAHAREMGKKKQSGQIDMQDAERRTRSALRRLKRSQKATGNKAVKVGKKLSKQAVRGFVRVAIYELDKRAFKALLLAIGL